LVLVLVYVKKNIDKYLENKGDKGNKDDEYDENDGYDEDEDEKI
jgi:hypothetical protein